MDDAIRPTTPDWGRVVERLCFGFPPVVGVGLVGILEDVEGGVPYLERGLFLVGTFGYALLTVAVAIAVVLDARAIRETRQWRPNPWINGFFAIAWAPVAGAVYLYRRHERFGTPPGWSGWWLVVALSLVATVSGFVAAAVGVVLAMPGLVTTGGAAAGAIAFGAFPAAIHQDAAYACTRAASWRPNPGFYLGVAFLSLVVPPLQPAVAAYYLSRRSRAIGPS